MSGKQIKIFHVDGTADGLSSQRSRPTSARQGGRQNACGGAPHRSRHTGSCVPTRSVKPL